MMNIILLLHEIDYVSISYCIVLSIIHSTISIAYISKRGGKERKAELTELMNLENCNVYLLYSKQFIFTHSEYIKFWIFKLKSIYLDQCQVNHMAKSYKLAEFKVLCQMCICRK